MQGVLNSLHFSARVLPGSDSARTFLARLTSAQPVDVVPVLGKPIPITRRPASMSGIGCQEADIKLPDGTRVGNGLWGSSVLRSPRRAASGRAPPQLMPTNTTCQIISVAACAGIPTKSATWCCSFRGCYRNKVATELGIQAWLAMNAPRFRALLPAPWADLALVSGSVHLF